MPNAFLHNISAKSRSVLDSMIEPCELPAGQILHEVDKAINYVYFPVSGMISLVVPLDGKQNIEAAVVGRDGIVGVTAILDSPCMHVRSVVQIPGKGYRANCDDFKRAIQGNQELDTMARRCLSVKLQTFAQTAACNSQHNVRQRFCRWLLCCHDRMDGDQFPLTQKFMAEMLGSHRPTISDAAARMQYDGLIRYKRGVITVCNREGLERESCECYHITRRYYESTMDIRRG